MSEEKYKIDRVCNKCGESNQIFVSKREAIFELYDLDVLFGNRCNNCSSDKFIIHHNPPELDLDILKEWATNEDFYLMPQDEDLLLADKKYYKLVLQILDTISLSEYKQNVLLESLCVIVYDNSSEDNEDKDFKLKHLIVDELNKRIDLLLKADKWIGIYIKDIVYPQLDFQKNSHD